MRNLVLSGQIEGSSRRRGDWLPSVERPNDRLVVGILLATSRAAPRSTLRAAPRAKRSWLM